MKIIKNGCIIWVLLVKDNQIIKIKFMIQLILILVIRLLDMIERINRMLVILKWEFNIELVMINFKYNNNQVIKVHKILNLGFYLQKMQKYNNKIYNHHVLVYRSIMCLDIVVLIAVIMLNLIVKVELFIIKQQQGLYQMLLKIINIIQFNIMMILHVLILYKILLLLDKQVQSHRLLYGIQINN